jgi:hypothetical protein
MSQPRNPELPEPVRSSAAEGGLSFEECVARLRAGDEGMAAEIFHRFAHRLLALVRSRLDSLLRPKVDPEDLLQSVFHSFLRGRGACGDSGASAAQAR